MGTLVAFRVGRPADPLTADDLRDEVTALDAERRDMVAAARPLVAQLVTYGLNASPLVLTRARALEHLLDRAERRSLGGAA